MAGPWEDYAASSSAPAAGPWSDYAAASSNVPPRFASTFWQQANPLNVAKGVIQTIAHPADALAGWGQQFSDLKQRTEDAWNRGEYAEAGAHALNLLFNVIPGIGKAGDDYVMAAKNYGDSSAEARSALGNFLGSAVGMEELKVLPGAVKATIPPVAKAAAALPSPGTPEVLAAVSGHPKAAAALYLRKAVPAVTKAFKAAPEPEAQPAGDIPIPTGAKVTPMWAAPERGEEEITPEVANAPAASTTSPPSGVDPKAWAALPQNMRDAIQAHANARVAGTRAPGTTGPITPPPAAQPLDTSLQGARQRLAEMGVPVSQSATAPEPAPAATESVGNFVGRPKQFSAAQSMSDALEEKTAQEAGSNDVSQKLAALKQQFYAEHPQFAKDAAESEEAVSAPQNGGNGNGIQFKISPEMAAKLAKTEGGIKYATQLAQSQGLKITKSQVKKILNQMAAGQ